MNHAKILTRRLTFCASSALSLVAFLWAPKLAQAQGAPTPPAPYNIRALAMPEANTLSNLHGQIAGYYPGYDAFLWDSPSGSFTEVGTLADMYVRPTGINDSGQIVGESIDYSMQPQVFLWQNGEKQSLGVPCVGTSEDDYYINNAGQVAGACSPGDPRGFLWENGSATEIEVRERNKLYVTGLSNSGIILGGYDGDRFYEPFVWKNRVMTMVTVPGAASYGATHINDGGQVAGSYTDENGQSGGFLWQDDNATIFGFGNGTIEVGSINSGGAVVGTTRDAMARAQAFVYQNGVMTLLETPAGEESSAVWINETGLIVGKRGPIGQGLQVPCLWRDGHLLDLNETLPAYLHWVLISVRQVTNSGDILAVAARNGAYSLVVLHPLLDSDGDGLPDEWETGYGLNAQSAADADVDSDADGLLNWQEYQSGTDPTSADTDTDGIPDGWEVAHAYDPRDPHDAQFDADGDGLKTRQEYLRGTLPWDPDSDNDALFDGQEVDLGTDPLNADSDGDGTPDGWELTYGFDPLDTLDSSYDADNDGLANLQEFQHGTNPRDADSDHDGLTDRQEIQLGLDPLNQDTDSDGMADGWETTYGLDPFSNDNLLDPDGDGFSNLQEYFFGTDPNSVDSDSDGDGRPDIVDPWPTDYFDTSLPTLVILDGANQAAIAGAVLAQPLVVTAADSYGQPLRNAPLLVTASPVGAAFSASPEGPFSPDLSVRTGENGVAIIYVQTPSTPMTFSVNIAAISGTNSRVVSAVEKSVYMPSIAAGEYHTVVLGSSGMVWTWGLNSSGQLGDGTNLQRSLPAPVVGLSDVRAVAAGAYHSVALKHDGTVWAWGANRLGQLGNGSNVDSRLPVPVGTLRDIVAISAGSNHSLALRADGAVYAWGLNSNGQLGDGTTHGHNNPVLVSGTGAASGIEAISAGAYHSLALLDNGTVKGWGANFYGALGGNPGAQSSVPVTVPLTGVRAVAAGAYHTMAVTTSGMAVALGWNGYGQLGDNTTISRDTIDFVENVSALESLAASKWVAGHCIALAEDGSVRTWGGNSVGQLGDNSTVDRWTPEEVQLPIRMVSVAAGGSHTIALASDGAVYAWGNNQFGELGDGTTINRLQPIRKAGLSLLPTDLDTDQDGLPDSWERQHFGGLFRTADSDPDQDGLVTLLEYQTGRDPNVKDYSASNVAPTSSQLIQGTVHAPAGTGDDVIIAGFLVQGDAPKTVIFRALGPSLGLPGTLADPQLQLFDATGLPIAYNDNWWTDPLQVLLLEKYAMNEGLQSSESALVITLPPGSYTAHISGVGNTTGIALFEIFDVDQSDSDIANLSARARLTSGDNVLIAGFVVDGSHLRVLVRAAGPSLALWGLPGVLPNPYLVLNDSVGEVVDQNDNWVDSPQRSEIEASTMAPLNALEPAVVDYLAPGLYTALVFASPGTPISGLALVEVYALDGGQDSDGDGLTDWEETNVYHTNPHDADTDDDGMNDGWEVTYGLDPLRNDAQEDYDGDGITNLAEYQANTDPAHFDLPVGTTVGATEGKLSVDNSGGAGYSIPISISPGTAGMQPKLSFEYSSRSGNSVLGIGWSISGLSAISRSPATMAHDEFIHGVNFTGLDRFSIDGQRLIAVAGTYGENGTEYRTEINSFSKIVSLGQSGSGPRSFTVHTKTGLIYTYGETDESRFIAQGRSEALAWALSKISDTSGNYILFRYFQNQSTGEYLPTAIEYTNNEVASLHSFASVRFEYESREDPAINYIAGSKVSQTQRMKSVTSWYGSELVRRYDLAYSFNPVTGRSRLHQIQEKAGEASFNPTTFSWSTDGEEDVLVPSAFNPTPTDDPLAQRWLPGDFNGDGRSDIAKVSKNNLVARLEVHLAQPSQPGEPTNFQTPPPWSDNIGNFRNNDTWLGGDFNGDGKLDILRFHQKNNPNDPNAEVHIYSNQGTLFHYYTCPVTGALPLDFNAARVVYPADVNGDGKLDLIVIHGSAGVKISVLLNTGDGGNGPTFQVQTWHTGGSDVLFADGLNWFVGDVTGDGLPDVIFLKNQGNQSAGYVYLNRLDQNENGFYERRKWITPVSGDPLVSHAIWLSGDFNGDGLVDLACLTKGSSAVQAYLATGQDTNGFKKESWGNLSRPVVSTSEMRGGDFNGDGRSDIGVVFTDPVLPDGDDGNYPPIGYTSTWQTYVSNGTTGFNVGSPDDFSEDVSSFRIRTLDWLPADFNGDGKEDFARTYKISSQGGLGKVRVNVWTGSSSVHDLLESVTDGMGSGSSVAYSTLANSNVYSRSAPGDTLANTIDLMAPMFVVSSASYDDGLGGAYAINYQYNGLKASPRRGLLGFRSVTSTDQRTLVWNRTTLRQDFPYTGMAEQMESHQGGNDRLISLANSTYADRVLHEGRVHSPYAQSSVTRSFDLEGPLTTQTTTTVNDEDIDDYGNIKKLVVATNGGFSKTTVSNYDVDPATWRIGKLRDSTVTNRALNQPDIIRKSGFAYAPNGQIGSETIEPDNAVLSAQTTYEYDGFGNTHVATTTGPDIQPRRTITNYDENGRLVTSVVNPLNHVETREYDQRWGTITLVTGPNGLSTRTIYDDFGRKRLEIRPDGSRTITTYEAASTDPDSPAAAVFFVKTVGNGSAPIVTYFDRLGRELRKKAMSGVGSDGQSRATFIDTTYNSLGQVQDVSRPYFTGGSIWKAKSFYDLLGRVHRVETPKAGGGWAVSTTIYRGLNVDSINPLQQGTSLKTTTTSDTQGRLIKVTDAKGGTIDYTYDAVGNLIQTKDAANNLTIMTYDVRGRKRSMDDPDLGLWTYDYNSLGELVTQRDARNNTTTMQYDQLGRMMSRTEPEGVSAWTYDEASGKGIGKLQMATYTPNDPSVPFYTRNMSYDDLGRPVYQTEQIDAATYGVGTTYDSNSRVLTVTYPTGFAVRHSYDVNGYMQKIQRNDAGGPVYWKANSYDAEGHVTQQEAGNGIVTDRVYIPPTGNLRQIHSRTASSSSVQNLSYWYDAVGNLSYRTDALQTVNGQTLREDFQYDELNRLTHWTTAGQATKQAHYDLLGNITSKDGVGTYVYTRAPGSPPLLPNERLHPHAVRSINGAPDATYDLNGNMTSGLGRTMTWTSFNMPRQIARGNASSHFAYDSDHNRIKQLSQKAGLLTTTIYVNGGMFEEVTKGMTIERKHYISSPAGRIALYTEEVAIGMAGAGDPPAGTTTESTRYLHKDHLNSIDTITNEQGEVIERDSFDAWGARRTTDWQPAVNPIESIVSRGFTGHEQLDDLGLVHMNGRIYDGHIGRFLSADPFVQTPIETQNYNRYSYVLNNPTSFTDPSGFNFLKNFGRWLHKHLGSTGALIVIGVIAAVVAVAAWYAAPVVFSTLTGISTTVAGGALSMTGVVVAGAGSGFASTFISTQLSGASLSQSLELAAVAGVLGGLTAGFFKAQGVGGIPDNFPDYIHDLGLSSAAGAIDGGVLSVTGGGDFLHGAGTGALYAAGSYVVVTSAVTYLTEQGVPLYPEGRGRSQDPGSYHKSDTTGILTSRESAQRIANGARDVVVYWNPTQGPINDILQTVYQKMFFGAGDSLARGYAALIGQLDQTQALSISGFSQGGATAVNAARLLKNVPSGSKLILKGGAINYYTAGRVARAAGFIPVFSRVPFDISNVFGPSFNPLQFISGFGDIFTGFRVHTSAYPGP